MENIGKMKKKKKPKSIFYRYLISCLDRYTGRHRMSPDGRREEDRELGAKLS